MSSNKRIFYACQAVAIGPEGLDTYAVGNMVHGVQSIGITTNFNLEQAFELGQIEIYENIEGTPDIEVTMEKVLDGYPLIYHLATTGIVGGAQSGLAARSDQKCDVRLGIFDAAANNVSVAEVGGSGRAEVEVYMSGMFISSISYTIPVDGNCTESATLVGNNKEWLSIQNENNLPKITDHIISGFNGTDRPFSLGASGGGASGGIQRREDVILSGCILPADIDGINGSGYGNGVNGTTPIAHLQSVTISTDFGREDILELGRKTPYFRPANFPIEVTCEIEAITVSGDLVDATEAGNRDLDRTVASGDNLLDQTIFMFLRAGYGFDLGDKNKLSSVSYGGGDAGGGNVSCTYSYTNFNQLDVQDFNNQGVIGFGAITLSAGTDANGIAKDKGTGPFPNNLVTYVPA